MKPRNTVVTTDDLLADAELAAVEFNKIDEKYGKVDCLKRIAIASQALQQEYDVEYEGILDAVSDRLEELGDRLLPPIAEVEHYKSTAIESAREFVMDTEQSLTDDKWLAIRYIKPTIKLRSVDALLGFTAANPEAHVLQKPVPPRTQVIWQTENLNV